MGLKGIRAALTSSSPVTGNSTEKFTQSHTQKSFYCSHGSRFLHWTSHS